MTINDTRNTVRQARSIGFSRREVMKFGLIAAGALVAAACGSDSDPVNEVVEKFAVGTWKVRYQTTSNGRSTSGPTPPVEFTVTVNSDSTFTTEGDSSLPASGTWMFGSGFVQITGDNETGMASNMPEKMQASADLAWSYGRTNVTVPAKWDSGSNTLTLTGLDANGGNFPITAVKQ